MNKSSPKCDREKTAAQKFADPRSWCHRDGREFLFGQDMSNRRHEVWLRSKGFCEMPIRGVLGGYCNCNISWETFELHHRTSRANGGDEAMENLVASCRRCHVHHHNRSPQMRGRL
jgi:5-methylcytosine-specific restriction endonuclease McrA